ncbi:MAG: helix-turn-helix transcriptional regulator [Rhodovibrionaceae bacterium]
MSLTSHNPLLHSPTLQSEMDSPRDVVCFGREYPARYRVAAHHHPRAQLVNAEQGVMSVKAGDGAWVVPPGYAVWVPAGVVHEVESLASLSMRGIYCRETALGAKAPSACRVVEVSPLLRELILRATQFEVTAAPSPREAHVQAVILDEILHLREAPLFVPLPGDARLKRITESLMEAPGDGRDLESWAQESGASSRTLARLFRKETGLSFREWRARMRLMTGLQHLASGDSVTTVALDVGYSGPSAFIAAFKGFTGHTPGEYLRKRLDAG